MEIVFITTLNMRKNTTSNSRAGFRLIFNPHMLHVSSGESQGL